MLALPLELVDGIVDFVDDRPDILSLALTCRFLTDRLIPSVLDYREIATSIQPKALWTQLAENPSLAQNIRVLRIKELVGGALKIPRVFRLPPDERFVPDTTVLPRDHPSLILPALHNMTKLVSFDWDWEREIHAQLGYNPILEVLHERCLGLRDLALHDQYLSDDESVWAVPLDERNSKLPTLRNITSFRYRLLHPRDFPNITPIPFIIKFISNNSSLHTLRLEFNSARLSHYDDLAQIHLPLLHTLSLSALNFSSTIFLSFLYRNPTIQVLDVCVDTASDSPTTELLEGLKEGSLPNLHTFVAFTVRSWICVCNAKPPLTLLEDLYIDEWDGSPEQTAALLAVSETLEKVKANQGDVYFGSESKYIKKWFDENLPNVQLEIIGEW